MVARESELPARTMNTGMPSLAMSTAVCGKLMKKSRSDEAAQR
jgi:hypothetical protein